MYIINDTFIREKEKAEMDDLFMILGWGSPVGIGIFLVLLGLMIFLIAKADEVSKRVKHEYKNKK